MKKRVVSFCFLTSLFLPLVLVAQTPPDEFLGHRVGADRKLADYEQIQVYFRQLAEESAKIKILTIGQSTLNKPMIMAVITSEENMAHLDKHRKTSRKLRDARGLTPEEAARLSRGGKVIVLITCGIHATEIGSSQMAMEFAYKLVTGKTPFDADRVLEDVIILIAPTINPDGHQMATEWYRKYVGTRYEGGPMPWLYHHYAGHDNNRDWFMLNLSETKAATKVMYHDWIPQVHIDEHEMDSRGGRLWLPPFGDPPNPNVHPLIWRGVAAFGTNMARDLQKNGFEGIAQGRDYAGWWDGACDNTPWFHNTICLLSESAEVRVASPIYIDATELSESYTEKSMRFPDPWPGGWWRLRDIVDYELALSMSLVKTAYLYKEELLYDFYRMGMDAIEKREEGRPFAFVISKEQWDDTTMLRMLDTLMLAGVEIHQAQEDFIADDKFYLSGSFVVLTSQPYGPYLQALLEIQNHPDLRREYPGGPFVPPPYDNAGWTLPLQMGVKCDQINESFKVDLTKLDKVPYPSITPPQETASYIVLDSRLNASFAVVFQLLQEGAEIYRSKDMVNGKGFEAAAGSFVIKNTAQVGQALPALLDKWHVKAYGLDNIAEIEKAPLKKSRIGLYRSWRANMDEGWTRYVFEDLAIPYTSLRNEDFKKTTRTTNESVNLNAKFDVIVFADEDAEIIKQGKPSPSSRSARFYEELPSEYQRWYRNRRR